MSVQLRAAIASALSTVGDVHGFAKQPSAFKAGDAWPLWGGAERYAGGGPFITSWRILVALPADTAAADTWIEDHLDDLVDALQPVVHVDRIDPVRIGSGDNAPPALQFLARE